MKKATPAIFTSPFGDVKYALVLNQKQFKKAMKALGVKDKGAHFLDRGADAQVTWFENGKKQIVQLGNTEGIDPIAVVGLLAHESVHVWQSIQNYIGEDSPSREFEAYSIQRILQDLLWSHQELSK